MKKWFLLLLCLLMLTGCSHTYLERQIYPICLSVDVTETAQYRVGLQAPQSGSTGNTAYDVLSASGDTPMDALRVLAASTPYPLNFSQLRLCLVGYDAASTQPLRPLLRQLLEMPTMRPNAYVMVALGDAQKVMSAQKPDFSMRLSTHLNLLFERLHREKTLPDSTLSYCVRELTDGRADLLLCLCAVNAQLQKQPQQSPAPDDPMADAQAFAVGEPWTDALLPDGLIAGMLPRSGQNPVEYLGSAVVSRGRVSGVLTASETQLALRVLDEAQIRTAIDGDQIQLQILTPKNSDLEHLHPQILALGQKLQAMGSDVLRFGTDASRQFLLDAEWEAFRFRERYETAELAVGTEK